MTSEVERNQRRQFLAFACLSLGTLGLTVVVDVAWPGHFAKYFGSANPLVVVIAAIGLGGIALRVLQSQGWFEVLSARTLRGVAVSTGLATLLAVAIIIADVVLRYPEDINVPLPGALLFYPAVGYVAEMVFHVIPLTVLLLILAPVGKRIGVERLIGLCLLLTATLEPTFQLLFEENPLSWIGAYTWVHVYAIAFLQLHVFRRYGFVAMYLFRLIYYAYWHIAWGAIRLDVLF